MPLTTSQKERILKEWKASPYRSDALIRKKFSQHDPADVKDVISKSKYGVFSETPKKRVYRFVDTPLVRGYLAADVAYFDGFMGGSKVMVVQCLFSKMIFAEVMRRITGETSARALRKIFDRCGFEAVSIVSDKGVDFLSKAVQELFREKGIRHVIAGRSFKSKSWMAERGIRTLRGIVTRLKATTKENNLYRLISKAERIYNTTEHSRTKFKPVDLDRSRGPEYLLNLLKQRKGRIFAEKHLNVGDTVRLKNPRKKPFEKGSAPSFSEVVYKIVGTKPSARHFSYKLQDSESGLLLEGFYAEPNLRLVEQKK